MSNDSSSALSCFAPFLPASLYPETVGFIAGRQCAPLGDILCCLPCPKTDYLYPDNFRTITNAVSWINVVGAACCVFLLASFATLPVEKTHRHYLSICLAAAVVMMHLGFIVPLASSPPECADRITPNDMHSNTTCGVSGFFLIAGGWCAATWVFMRAFALHLQICWQKSLGKGFMYGAFAAGWGFPLALVSIALALSGVSFRFGKTCHINHKNSLADFWIPLLVVAGLTVIIQGGTFAYCVRVYYLAARADGGESTTQSSGLPSYQGTIRTVTPRMAYRRVRRVIELQWRGLTQVMIIIADVIFFAVVFVWMDGSEQSISRNPGKSLEWAACLALNGGDKNKCLKEASRLVMNETVVMAVLVLLSLNGIWLLLLMGRFSMFTGWAELFQRRLRPNKEFISADAHKLNFSKDSRAYEMLSKETGEALKTPEAVITPLTPAARSGRETPDYFGVSRDAPYHQKSTSFSSPRPPSVGRNFASSPPLQQHPYMRPLGETRDPKF